MNSAQALNDLLETIPQRLEKVATPGTQPEPGKWSAKQELGHLLDSAINNHRRIVLTQLEDRPALSDYDGERWVEAQQYQNREWPDLIRQWQVLNEHLLMTVTSVQEADWSRMCTIGNSGPLTLRFVVDDYVKHMVHHLKHIGVAIDDSRQARSA